MTESARTALALALALLCAIPWVVKAAADDVEAERVETIYRFQEDGSGQVTVHAKWKALTGAGVKAITQFSIPFVSEFEDLHVPSFRTIKKNGQTLEGESKQVFDAALPAQPAAPVFTGTKYNNSCCQMWKQATRSNMNL